MTPAASHGHRACSSDYFKVIEGRLPNYFKDKESAYWQLPYRGSRLQWSRIKNQQIAPSNIMAYISQNYMQSKFYVQILSNFTVWSFEAKYYIYATDPSPFENIEIKNIVCTKNIMLWIILTFVNRNGLFSEIEILLWSQP